MSNPFRAYRVLATALAIVATVIVLGSGALAAASADKNTARIVLTAMTCPQGLDDPPRAYLGEPPRGHFDYGGKEIAGPPVRLGPGVFQFTFFAETGSHLVTVTSQYCSGREVFATLANHDRHVTTAMWFNGSPYLGYLFDHAHVSVAGTLPEDGLRVALVLPDKTLIPQYVENRAYYVENVQRLKYKLLISLTGGTWALRAAVPLDLTARGTPTFQQQDITFDQIRSALWTVRKLVSRPTGITAGSDGSMWFTDNEGNTIGRISQSGTITEYPIAIPESRPDSITVDGAGNLWFTQYGYIGRIDVKGAITEFSATGMFLSGGIGIGPGNNVWFTTDTWKNAVVKMSPTGTLSQFPVSHPDNELGIANAGDLVIGPDKNIWFVETYAGKIGCMTPEGSLTDFKIPTPNPWPLRIAIGVEGNYWFSEMDGDKIGRLGSNGLFTEWSIPTAEAKPMGIALDKNGSVWFAESNGNAIGVLDSRGKIAEYPLPNPSSEPDSIAAGPDGYMWFTEPAGHRIGKVSPSGQIIEYPIPAASASPGNAY